MIMNAKTKRMPFKNSVYCFLAALIWGLAFVSQSKGMDYLGPFSFNGARSLLGAAVLLPIVHIRKRKGASELPEQEQLEDLSGAAGRSNRKIRWIGGICCGLALCVASSLQQIGIQYTSVGKAGFITALYIILVPVFSVFLGRRAPVKVWFSAVIAAVGLYLLCINESFSLTKGDAYVMASAAVFALHILLIDYFSPKMDGVELSFRQFLVVGVLCCAIGFVIENPTAGDFIACALPLAFSGIMSCGVAYTLQILGQKNADPAIAALILSLEAVISVLAGWLILSQTLSVRELIGCAIVFAAVVLVQFPAKQPKNGML